ncbi:MAG TPA: hypothetical protein VG271_11280 [Beijerinckiaceae bacterium]|nr:hypothetical protein [Beijerinckiaceae bacterium]
MRLPIAMLMLILWAMPGARAQTESGARNLKTARIVVGSDPGGSYDGYARLIAPFLGKYLPGRPNVVVENMPGGGGLKLANYMAQIAPHDGSEIGIADRNLIVAPLLKLVEMGNVHYDPAKFVWIANLNSDVSFLIVRTESNIKTIDDLRRREVLVGSTSQTDNNGIFPYISNNLIGTHFKVITGYPSSNAIALAMDRGEIDGVDGFSWSSIQLQKPEWLRDHKVVLLMQLGLKPLPQQPDVPMILDLAKTEDDRKALEVFATLNTLGRPFFAPPQLSADAAAMWRQAFAAAVKDDGFLAMVKQAKFDFTFTDGETVQQTVERLNAISPTVAAIATDALKRNATEVQKATKP